MKCKCTYAHIGPHYRGEARKYCRRLSTVTLVTGKGDVSAAFEGPFLKTKDAHSDRCRACIETPPQVNNGSSVLVGFLVDNIATDRQVDRQKDRQLSLR